MSILSSRTFVAVSLACCAVPVSAQIPCPSPFALEETLRIGSVSGADALTFPLGVEVDANGRIYVTQSLQPFVSVFDSQGRVERTIGRAGQGPGELRLSGGNIGWRGDTLWVSDTEGVLFFRPNGQYVREVRFRTLIVEELSVFTPRTPLADGTLLARRGSLGRGPSAGSLPQIAMERGRLPVRRFAESGDVVDTLTLTDWTGRYVPVPFNDELTDFREHPMLHRFNVGPMDTHPMGVPTRDGHGLLLIGEVRTGPGAASFDLLRLGLDGDTLLRRAVPYQPRPVTRVEADELRTLFAGWVAGDYFRRDPSEPLETPAASRSRQSAAMAITFPEFHPPVREMIAGNDGSIWILREFERDGAGRWVDRWEIYDERGERVGAVVIAEGKSEPFIPWAPRLMVLRATLDEVWGVTTDDLDVPYLHRYRVRRTCD